MKVSIDRKTCIACGACGAIADEVYDVPPGHKSLFSIKNIEEFKVLDLDNNLKYIVKVKDKKYILKDKEDKETIKEFENVEELSNFIGEDTIVIADINDELYEEALMGEQACPVNAIRVEKE